ncbi:MAG: DinB family protein [Deltaproteobacteria bacterium]|nr:DinB family protein [Deltaproteobacteria bacterium]
MPAARKSFEEWVEPLARMLETGDFLGVARKSPPLFRKIASSGSRRWFGAVAGEEPWTRLDVLAHMTDTEAIMTVRIRKMLAEDDPAIPFFDQERWIEALRPFRGGDPKRIAARFAAMRAENIAVLASLAPAQMKRTGVHPERGRMTIADLLAGMARHDVGHLRQIIAG